MNISTAIIVPEFFACSFTVKVSYIWSRFANNTTKSSIKNQIATLGGGGEGVEGGGNRKKITCSNNIIHL